MSTDIGVFICAQHHGHRIPTGIGTNPVFNILIARQAGLILNGNRIDVRCLCMEGLIYTIDSCMRNLLIDEISSTLRTFVMDDTI